MYVHDHPKALPRVMYACASNLGVTVSEWRWASWGTMGMGASAAGSGAWLLARSRDCMSRPIQWEECFGHTCHQHKRKQEHTTHTSAQVEEYKGAGIVWTTRKPAANKVILRYHAPLA